MKIYKTKSGIIIEHGHDYYLSDKSWDDLVNRPALRLRLEEELVSFQKLDRGHLSITPDKLLPPVGNQEVWAAGVTYLRSKKARMEESKDAGGGTFYDRVYEADRPELFFKSSPQRVIGHGHELFIRNDSEWNVPEPELTLFISSEGNVEGYTIGNDMSSRSIEGENPLYLPQAKVYDKSAGIGPCLYVPSEPLPSDTGIRMFISRNGEMMYSDVTAISQIKRKFSELADYLFSEMSFPHGCYLMTGTCLVPPDNFTLQAGDEVRIEIDHIGALVNSINYRQKLVK